MLKIKTMNKKDLFDEIVALSPMQQENVEHYVSFLKKKGKNNTYALVKNVNLLEMLSEDEDNFMDYLNEYALQAESVAALTELFEDAPSAEELCAMLTK